MPAIDPTALSDPRRRLLDALAGSVAAKGYALTTIADVAAAARVSKRTFYEHFSNKEDALFALYEAASAQAMHTLTAAIDPAQDWHGQAERAIGAYLATLASNPPLLRTLFIEILHLGPEGLRVRRRVNQAIADFIVGTVTVRGGAVPAQLPLMAIAIVGGINELILQAIEDGRVEQLPELAPSASLLLRCVIDGATGAALTPAAAASRS